MQNEGANTGEEKNQLSAAELPPLERDFQEPKILAIPQCVVYTDADFGGESWTVFDNWNIGRGSTFDDSISSIVVVSGIWVFTLHHDYGGKKLTLGPGTYRAVDALPNGPWNDQISCLGHY